jgi:hypothetical protein
VHSFHARRKYLQDIKQRNGETRRYLEEEQQAALTLQRELAEEAARTKFDQSIRKMHHLVSTSQIPGIFNSPYDTATAGPPSKDGVPLDDHLRSSIRTQVTDMGTHTHNKHSADTVMAPADEEEEASAAVGAGGAQGQQPQASRVLERVTEAKRPLQHSQGCQRAGGDGGSQPGECIRFCATCSD